MIIGKPNNLLIAKQTNTQCLVKRVFPSPAFHQLKHVTPTKTTSRAGEVAQLVKVLVAQAWDPEFKSQHPRKNIRCGNECQWFQRWRSRNRRLHVACWPASLSKFVIRRLSEKPCLRNLCEEWLRSHLTLISDLHAQGTACIHIQTHAHTPTENNHNAGERPWGTCFPKPESKPAFLSTSIHRCTFLSKNQQMPLQNVFLKKSFKVRMWCVYIHIHTREHAGAYMPRCAWDQRTTLTCQSVPSTFFSSCTKLYPLSIPPTIKTCLI